MLTKSWDLFRVDQLSFVFHFNFWVFVGLVTSYFDVPVKASISYNHALRVSEFISLFDFSVVSMNAKQTCLRLSISNIYVLAM